MNSSFRSAFLQCRRLLRLAGFAMIAGLTGIWSGCETTGTGSVTPTGSTPASAPAAPIAPAANDVLVLREGDVIRVAFPGVPAMDTTQPIRRDGKITLPLVGEVDATGMTPTALQQKLSGLYAPQLVNKDVLVTVVSSSFTVFVSGAVARPGRVNVDRPLTLLEAVMEAGGVDFARANTAAVVVIRQSEGNRRYTVNLKAMLDGTSSERFYLKPSDVVIVPEKMSIF